MFFLGKYIRYREDKKIQTMDYIRIDRTKRLEKSIRKKFAIETLEGQANEKDLETLLEEMIQVSDFHLKTFTKKWLLENCGGCNELIYAFQMLMQRALNNGTTYSSKEDSRWIDKNIDFSVLYSRRNSTIGKVSTFGKVGGKSIKIEISCCAIPAAKLGKGKLTCTDTLSINYIPLKRIMKDYNIFIKLYPSNPENTAQWEGALVTAVYSAILNKVLPSPIVVLGGMTKDGKMIPIEEKLWTEVYEKNKTPIIVCLKNEGRGKEQVKEHSQVIDIKHIEEILLMMKRVTSKEEKGFDRDILCET